MRCSIIGAIVGIVLQGAALFVAGIATADDWPQWRGPERDGVWREQGIVEKFDSPQLTDQVAPANWLGL
jgi:hypothetical protein